jgi:pre-rRNA-processing protein IPI1
MQITASLHSRLIPYFYMDHPARGALPGPYKKLPPVSSSRLRLLVLDVVSTVLGKHSQEDNLSKAVALAVAGEEEQDYWSHVSNSSFMNKK